MNSLNNAAHGPLGSAMLMTQKSVSFAVFFTPNVFFTPKGNFPPYSLDLTLTHFSGFLKIEFTLEKFASCESI